MTILRVEDVTNSGVARYRDAHERIHLREVVP